MRKTLCWLIAVAMLIAMMPSVFATEASSDEGLVLGNNVLEAVSNQTSEYTYTATETGTLYITIRNWTMNGIENSDRILQWGWSKILVNGTQLTALTSSLEVTAGEVITFAITSDGDRYSSNVFLSMEGYYEEPLGSEFNPVVLTPGDMPTTSIEIPAGGTVWYQLEDLYDYNLRVYGEDAYIVSFYFDYSVYPYPLVSTYHYAEDGFASYTVEYQYVMIGNAGTETATFQIDGSLPEGHSMNPAELIMGEQTVAVAFEQYAHYIEWTAPSDGTLTLVFSGEMWRYNVVNAGDPSDYNDDGTTFSSRALNEEPVDTVAVEVKEGDLVRIDVGCSDADFDLPAGTITINASFAPAGGEEEPAKEGSGTLNDPWVVDSLPCVIEGTLGADLADQFYSIVITEPGSVYIEDFSGCSVYFLLNGEEGYVEPVTVAADDVLTVGVWGYAAGDYTISLGFTPGDPNEGGDDAEQKHYEGGELVVGDNTIGINAGEAYSPEYTFTPEADGYLTLDVLMLVATTKDGSKLVFTPEEIAELLESYYVYLLVNGEDYTGPVEVTAGTAVTITLVQNRMYQSQGYSLEATLNLSVDGGSETPELSKGDVNGDGAVNHLDAMLVAQYYVGDETSVEINVIVADVNGDGVVNHLDAMLIAQYYVGDIDSFDP